MKLRDILFPPRGAIIASLFALGALSVIAAPIKADDAQRAQKWREMQVGPKPDWSWLPRLRVLTEADYPPFNYYDEEARLTGFNVDLARAICRELVGRLRHQHRRVEHARSLSEEQRGGRGHCVDGGHRQSSG